MSSPPGGSLRGDPQTENARDSTPTEFFKWWIVDERTGKRRLTRYAMTRADAAERFPDAEPDLGTREVRSAGAGRGAQQHAAAGLKGLVVGTGIAVLISASAEIRMAGGMMDRDDAIKKLWRAELTARLELLDRMILERSIRENFVRKMDSERASVEKRPKLLEETRQHYSALLKQHLLDGKLPTPIWGDLHPDVPFTRPSLPTARS